MRSAIFAHPANQPRAEIPFDAFEGGGQALFAHFHGELTAVLGMVRPLPRQLQPFAGVQLGQIADHGDERFTAAGVLVGQHRPAIGLQPQNGVTRLGTIKGNALHRAANGGLVGHGGIKEEL
jgi:hypothetical protein